MKPSGTDFYSATLQKDSFIRVTMVILLAAGFLLRTYQYFFNRSLWLDEAMLALNIVDRSFSGLTQPLAYSQGAPIGFLFIQKLAITLLGNHDYILRLFPFIASVAALFLFYHLARAVTGGLGLILATGLFSTSHWLIYYASESKQYSSDAMVCLLLLLCGERCSRIGATTKDFMIMTLAGVISLWLSHPSLFVFCGVAVGLFLDCCIRKRDGDLKRILVVVGVWAGNFLLLYTVSLRRLSADSVLVSYWSDFFMPMPPWHNPAWFSAILTRILAKPVGLTIPWLGAILIAAGLAVYLVKNRRIGIIFLTPLIITLLASGVKKYPFGDRLLLFTLPILYLCIGEAIEYLRTAFTGRLAIGAAIISLAMAASLSYGPATQAIATVRQPCNDEDIKTVLDYVAHKKTGQDVLYLYYSAIPAFTYYAAGFGLNGHAVIKGIDSRGNAAGYIHDIAQLRGTRRVWFIFSHNYNWGPADEVAFFEYALPRMGTKLDEVRSVDAAAFLFSIN
jgi:hypothetical protein